MWGGEGVERRGRGAERAWGGVRYAGSPGAAQEGQQQLQQQQTSLREIQVGGRQALLCGERGGGRRRCVKSRWGGRGGWEDRAFSVASVEHRLLASTLILLFVCSRRCRQQFWGI